jgi:outer membrane receptor protein involved in Fe transport
LKQNPVRARLMASSMISGIALVVISAGAAQAADATADATTTSTTTEVVVTGSRIPQPNLTSVSPVTSVGQTELKLQGTQNIVDLINNLPQAFGDFGTMESNGATGTSTVDLRGIGNKRTLVLINGVRLQPGDPTSAAVAADIDMIPPALVDRVEVLTGGASAVYGSDAVAGVVNFIMKTHFQGIQIDEETTVSQDGGGDQQVRTANTHSQSIGFPSIAFPGNVWDGITQSTTITGGANTPDDKGNVEFYLGYTYLEAVNQGQRDYTKCTLATDNTSTTFQYCGGSTTDATGRINVTSNLPGVTKGNYDITLPSVGGMMAPFSLGQGFNYAPYNFLQRPDQRWTSGEFSDYKINDYFDVYSSFMFMDDHTVAAIAPSGSFFGDVNFTIPCNDPLLSSAQANTLCGADAGVAGVNGTAQIGRRNIEGGPRTADLEHMDFRNQIGVRGELGQGWSYDVGYLFGRSLLTESEGGYFLNSHLLNALNVVTDNVAGSPQFGQPVCASFLSGADTACVPYNLWTAGGVTKAALNYLTGVAENSGSTDEQIVTATVSNADLSQYGLKSPAAKDGFGISGGFEYRDDTLETQYDAVIESGDLAGFGGSLRSTAGDQNDRDVFIELRAPLIQDMPFAQDVTLETGLRYADYAHGGGNYSFKVGLDWQTVPDLRLRGSFERAVRAPNVEELDEPNAPGLFAGSDPCGSNPITGGGRTTPSFTPAECVNLFQHTLPGITVNQLVNGGYIFDGSPLGPLYANVDQCISGQCGNYSGGNPGLTPEIASTYSFGFVFTPTFFRNFNLTVDYWNIDVEKAIINLPAEVMLTNCGVLDNAFDCSQIVRNPASNFDIFGGEGAGVVNQPLVNASALKTSGVDVNAIYHVALDDWGVKNMGSLGFNFTGTYVQNLITQLPDGTQYDCAGLYGVTCGTPTPHWRHTFRVSWNSPWNATFSLNWRFIEGSSLDFNTNQPDLQDGSYKDALPTDSKIPNYNYFDLAVNWRIRDHFGLRAGVNNVADTRPPLLDANSFGISAPPFGNGNTYPQVYDALGRVFFLGLTADF